MIKFLCLSGEGNPLVREVEAQIWQTYRAATQIKGKTSETRKIFPP
jgi:hypothetical protein